MRYALASRHTIECAVAAATAMADLNGPHNVPSGLVTCAAGLMVTKNCKYNIYELNNPNPGNAAPPRLWATHLVYLSARHADARHTVALHENVQSLWLVYLAKRALG
jgi:hypothetical protein